MLIAALEIEPNGYFPFLLPANGGPAIAGLEPDIENVFLASEFRCYCPIGLRS